MSWTRRLLREPCSLFRWTLKMTYFTESKQVTPFHPGNSNYKPAMKATLVKSEPAASKRTRWKAQLRFSRLGSSLLHWLWACNIQHSAQIFPPDCRLFRLFQDFSPLKKVLHPEHPPCKPHALRIWSKRLPSKRLSRLASMKPTTSESHSRGWGNSSMHLNLCSW